LWLIGVIMAQQGLTDAVDKKNATRQTSINAGWNRPIFN
jgi:hypothetical protein